MATKQEEALASLYLEFKDNPDRMAEFEALAQKQGIDLSGIKATAETLVGPTKEAAAFERSKIMEQQRQEVFQEMAQDVGFWEAIGIGTGQGLTTVGRGVGIVDPATETERRGMEALREERPYSTGAGEIVGESLPFIPLAVATGGIASAPVRLAAAAGAGATEGGIIAKGLQEDVGKGVAIGAGVEVGAEVLFPVIGRIGGRLFKKITGKAPVGAMLDAAGKPSQELQGALDQAGLKYEDLVTDAQDMISKQTPGADPEQVARAAMFKEEGIPITKGEVTKDFTQLAKEEQLLRSITEEATPLREFKLKQSQAIEDSLNKNFSQQFKNEESGQLIKGALEGKFDLLGTEIRDLYAEGIENARDIGSFPVFTSRISKALPEEDILDDLAITTGESVDKLETLLAKYGIKEPTEEQSKKIRKITPLAVDNFERFRKSLNAISSGDTSGAIKVAITPIKNALDKELDELGGVLERRGMPTNITDLFKEARKSYITRKAEFNPKALAGKLIAKSKDGFEQMVEASGAYDLITSKATKIEPTRKLLNTLKTAGDEGDRALEALRSTTMLDLINAGFGTKSRQIEGIQTFNPIAFRNRINNIGEKKIRAIFKDNPDVLKSFDNIEKIAKELTVDAASMPKGSAASPMFIAALEKLGFMSLGAKVPVIGPLVLNTAKTAADAIKTRKSVKEALAAKPDIKEFSEYIGSTYPGIASALGIAAIIEEPPLEEEKK